MLFRSYGNGLKGNRENAPFDKIIVGGSVNHVPSAWKDQLAIGGRIVVPIGMSIGVFDKLGKDAYKEQWYFGFDCEPLVDNFS